MLKIPPDLEHLAILIGQKHQVETDLLCAIVMAESLWDTWSIRYEPRIDAWLRRDKRHVTPRRFARRNRVSLETERSLQAHSFGLTHVLGVRARELGYVSPLTELLRPQNALTVACRNLNTLMDRYANWRDVVCAYNRGSVKRNPDGTYRNQEYVDRVTRYLLAYRGRTL